MAIRNRFINLKNAISVLGLISLVMLRAWRGAALVNLDAVYCVWEVVEAGGLERVISKPRANTSTAPFREYGQVVSIAERNPQNPHLATWTGTVALIKGDDETSRDKFQEVLSLNPNDQRTGFLLGLVYHEIGETEEAVKRWRRLDDGEKILTGVGDRLAIQGKKQESLPYYQAALELNDRSPDTHLRLAEALYAIDHRAEALNHYMTAFNMQAPPRYINLGEALLHAANILAEQQRFQEALAALRSAVSISPHYVWYLATLGEVYASAGDYEDAEHWLSQAIQSSPSMAYPYWMMGKYYLGRNQAQQAVKVLEQAIRDPQAEPYIYASLGQACIAVGDVDRAAWAFSEAVRRAPGNVTYIQWQRSAQETILALRKKGSGG